MYPGIFLAVDGESLFGLIIFAVVVINVIRAVIKGQKQQKEQQKEQLRRPPPPRAQPGEQRAGREIEDFLEEISRGKSAPPPTAPQPAERPQYRSQQRPVPPVAHPVPPTVPYPIRRPPQQPRPQPATMRQPQPQPRRPLEPQPEKPRTIGAPSAPTSHPAGYKVAAAPAPASALHPEPPRKAPGYALEVADSLEVTRAEGPASAARLDELLPKDPLKRAIVLTELFGPCRAKRRLRTCPPKL